MAHLRPRVVGNVDTIGKIGVRGRTDADRTVAFPPGGPTVPSGPVDITSGAGGHQAVTADADATVGFRRLPALFEIGRK